jgi:CheY-like chemotaxis protein
VNQFNRRAPYRLLYVDDNPDDVLFFQEAVRMAEAPLILDCVSGPAAAMDYLDDLAQIVARQGYLEPALGLLDCHFHGVRSPNLVSWIREHPCFRSLPLVIFTGADSPEQVAKSYENGADYFLAKPSGRILSSLTLIVQALYEFIASYPPNCELLLKLAEYRPPEQKRRPRGQGAPVTPGFKASCHRWSDPPNP